MNIDYMGKNSLAHLIGKIYSVFAQIGHSHSKSDITDFPEIPTKTSDLVNDSGFKTTDNNTTYTLTKDGETIVLTGSDGSAMSVKDSDTKITVDSDLSSSSTNPVQNKVINTALGTKANASDLAAHTENSSNPHGVTLSQLGVTADSTELNYMDGVTSNVQTQLDSLSTTKANKADIATTAMQGTSSSTTTYWKISDFGNWGTGNWTQKGFSMLITSRAGEMVWVSLAANDSNTDARAIRLINRYGKIAALHYSVSESAIYVTAVAWANNICAHVLSNVNGDYVPTVVSATALPSDAVAINIVEFGINSTSAVVGDSSVLLEMGGSETRPTYNGNDVALYSDVDSLSTEIASHIEDFNALQAAVDELAANVVTVHSGESTPVSTLGEDGDIYLYTGSE